MHRAPTRGRPGIAAEHAVWPMLALAGHAEQAADDDRAPRHPAEIDHRHQARAGALDALLLRFEADQEARLVGERDQRQMEGVAELHQPHHLGAARHVGRAALYHRVVGHQPDRIAVDPRQPGDARAAVEGGDLEERAAVGDVLDQLEGVKRPAPLARHQRQQRLLGASRTVRRVAARRHLVHAARQVAQPTADLAEGVGLGLGKIVDAAADADVDVIAAQLLLGDVVAQRRLHHRRPAGEDLAHAAHHHREVRQRCLDRRQSRDRAQYGRHDRHGLQQPNVVLAPAVAVGQIGAAQRLEAAHAAAGGVEQPDIGQPPGQRALHSRIFLADRAAEGRRSRAAAHREVAGIDHDLAAVDPYRAFDRSFGRESGQPIVLVGRIPH